jgi:hypothetical protein
MEDDYYSQQISTKDMYVIQISWKIYPLVLRVLKTISYCLILLCITCLKSAYRPKAHFFFIINTHYVYQRIKGTINITSKISYSYEVPLLQVTLHTKTADYIFNTRVLLTALFTAIIINT